MTASSRAKGRVSPTVRWSSCARPGPAPSCSTSSVTIMWARSAPGTATRNSSNSSVSWSCTGPGLRLRAPIPAWSGGSIFRALKLESALRAEIRYSIWYLNQSVASSSKINSIGAASLPPEQLALFCAEYAGNKKAEEIVVLDMRGLSGIADFFVICSGTSEPHLKAIAGEIQERLREDHQMRPHNVDGYPMSQWIVVDYY